MTKKRAPDDPALHHWRVFLIYGAIHMVFRAGANPTGIRVTSFIDLMSTTETSLVCSLAM